VKVCLPGRPDPGRQDDLKEGNSMKKLGLAVTVFAAAFALTACGGGGNGAKLADAQATAQAVFGASNAYGSAQQNLIQRVASRAFSGEQTVSCAKGGSVTASVDVSGTDSSGNINLKLSFDGCVSSSYTDAAGTTTDVTTDGELNYAIVADSSGTASSVDFKLTGHLDFDGGISDSVDVDVTYSAGVSGNSYSVSFTGDITTGSGHSFHYDGSQAYTFDGTITAGTTP
jgi:hypothetical protein